MRLQRIADEVAADEAGAASNENLCHPCAPWTTTDSDLGIVAVHE
jgi:hypothetical protein